MPTTCIYLNKPPTTNIPIPTIEYRQGGTAGSARIAPPELQRVIRLPVITDHCHHSPRGDHFHRYRFVVPHVAQKEGSTYEHLTHATLTANNIETVGLDAFGLRTAGS
jgi:hypothetical protein